MADDILALPLSDSVVQPLAPVVSDAAEVATLAEFNAAIMAPVVVEPGESSVVPGRLGDGGRLSLGGSGDGNPYRAALRSELVAVVDAFLTAKSAEELGVKLRAVLASGSCDRGA